MPVSSQWFANPGVTYEIDQSIRFNDDDSAYLSRTPGSAGNRRTWTFSCWVKRGNLTGANQPIFSAGGDDWLMFLSAETLGFNTDGSSNYRIVTTQLFRDPGAWFHLVLRVDTTNSTAGDRLRLYINGSEVTDFGTDTNPTLNYDTAFNNTGEHNIGKLVGASQYFDGYLSEIHHVDGSSLGPDSFAETSSDTGQWVPKAYSGSYGTNGFYLKFQDSSSLGDDTSGNTNDFTSNNLAAADSVSDSPTANWCVWNPIDTSFNDNVTSDGNLKITTASPGYTRFQLGTIGVTSGKWEWKWTPTDSLSDGGIGVDDGTSQAATGASSGAISDQSANGVIYRSGGTKLVNGSATSYGASFAADDVIRVQLDLDSGTKTIEFFKNDSSQGTINLNDNVTYFPCQFSADAGLVTVTDFGQSGFTPASGFEALNTSNLDTPAITDGSKYFQSTLYAGNGSTQSINQSGNSTFQPDLVWIKNRSAADGHVLTDAVRGATKILASDATTIETTDADTLTAFESDGFALGDDDKVNTSSENFVAWQWLAGNSSGSTNDDGSVDSTVSVNTTAGFSICKFNPGGNSNITFGHGLGVAPRLVIVKNLEDATHWQVLHIDQGVGNKIFLNTTAARASDANMWQNTAPTSSVVSVGTSQTTNEQNIAYVWNEVEGYSRFRSYEGNGNADGPFVYTGFSPQFILFRCVSAVDAWQIYDTKRYTFNAQGKTLAPNDVAAESSFSARLDILSNGFKLRTTNTALNGSGETYIYIAFAEQPFGGSGVAPATAR